jgi:hypothetical protein
MKKIVFLMIITVICLTEGAKGQDDNWNKNYPVIEIKELLQYEKLYADSVDNGLISGNIYNRMSFFRFYGVYTGEKRKISKESKIEMKWVYKLHGDKNYASLVDDLETEYKFNIEGTEMWLSIQNQLEEAFEKEVRNNAEVLLYCIFFNNHIAKNRLSNYFLICEFGTDVPKESKENNWVQIEKNLNSKLTKNECSELFKSQNLRYLQDTGDTVYIKIENTNWTEIQESGKYLSKAKIVLKGDCEFESEFVESTNPEEIEQFKKGDKILYRIIETIVR